MSVALEPRERALDDAAVGPRAKIGAWVRSFAEALERNDPEEAAALFLTDGHWRDLLAFTWNIKTCEGRKAICAMLAARLPFVTPSALRVVDEASEDEGVVNGWFAFETAQGRGIAHLRLKNGRAWTLLTSMEELKGFEERKGRSRPFGAEHGIRQGRLAPPDRRQAEVDALGTSVQPYVVVVGGSQGGLALGARLRRLGVPTLIVEQTPRVGDSWRNRYKSLCLHDPVWYDHMPYLPFPDDWPRYAPKDRIADWLEMYARIMELVVWTSTTVKGARRDEATGTWKVRIDRDGQEVVLHPAHLVLATGNAGFPNLAEPPGADLFGGEQFHSSRYRGGEPYAGKRCVVVGSNNSAHDICADLWECGAAEVTMVQRSSTTVHSAEAVFCHGLAGLYSEDALERGITTETADLLAASMPYALAPEQGRGAAEAMKEHDAALHAALREVGFMLDFGDDDTGIGPKYIRRGSGYYIDVGASGLVANGSIRLKSGVDVARLIEGSVVLTDGSELPADLVVWATGYGSMSNWAAALIGPEVADKVGRCWGVGSGTTKDPGPWQGELRNMWKPTQQDGLWFQGGNLHQSRHYSQYLALQLKARLEGLPTPVYALEPTYNCG